MWDRIESRLLLLLVVVAVVASRRSCTIRSPPTRFYFAFFSRLSSHSRSLLSSPRVAFHSNIHSYILIIASRHDDPSYAAFHPLSG